MASIITIAGEKLFAAKAQANEQLDIDTFIFANVPNQDPTAPINREEGIPTEHKVHEQIVQQVGRINDNVVVYSTVLDSLTGPFEFNWVGLYSSVNQTLVAINHIPTTVKTITKPGVAGNTLNRNFGIEYSGIADLTGINVSPETWQLDFTARLGGMDKLTQQLAADMNGKDWFIEEGLKVLPRETANSFSVLPGVGYVSGLRIELKQEHILIVQSYPQFVYVDAWFSGNANSTWSPQLAFTITNGEMDDYVDPSGAQHYVYKLAVVNATDDAEDLRDTDGLSEKIDKSIRSATVQEVKSGKFKKVGMRLSLTDRDNGIFVITDEGSYDGITTLDAGNGKVAKAETSSLSTLKQFGAIEGHDVRPIMEALDALHDTVTTVKSGIETYLLSDGLHLRNKMISWDLSCTFDCSGNQGVSVVLDGPKINYRGGNIKNSGFYSILATPLAKECSISNVHSDSAKYTAFFDQGTDNTWDKLTSSDSGWDLCSTLGSVRSTWNKCIAKRPKRHGFSSDPSANGTVWNDCITIDNGGYLNEGSDAFHLEDGVLFDDYQVAEVNRCKAIYTDEHIALVDYTYKGLIRALRTENVYRTTINSFEIIASELIKEKLIYNNIILFGDSRITSSLITPSTVLNDLVIPFGIITLGQQDVVLNNPKGSFIINKKGYGGTMMIIEPKVDGINGIQTLNTFVSTIGGLQNIGISIKGGRLSNFDSVVDRICENCIFDVELINIKEPYKFKADISDSNRQSKNVVIKGKAKDITGSFLEEKINDRAENILVENVYFSGTIGVLRTGNFSTSKWVGCNASNASVQIVENILGGGGIHLNASARSSYDAIHDIVTQVPTNLFTPHSFGSTLRVEGGACYVAEGITSADWNLM
ncbi:phage tail protein [Shewanella sp. ULN5]|uniref:phage tail-collar fiber domain-containing protein n=1 Tax=Shewanella sp. ULN5 TaxID=2994678 RepID=UPI00273E642E|nr:phage tail protein [Shewanella sp. ULN5]MDP5145996.1 phage tail protein [Shewanella sp. ULN5]